MPSISSCPQCHRDLTIPDLADRQQSLRCPLCEAHFPAERALADSVKFPPAAIVVAADDAPGPGPAAGDKPTGLEPLPVQELAARSAVDDAGQPTASLGFTDESPTGAGESTADFDSFGQQAANLRVAPKARRQASPLGALGQLLGIALGGLLGLMIGYYVLIWIGGPRTDFLELRGKLPRWLTPPARRHNAAADTTPFSSQNRNESFRGGAEQTSMQGDLPGSGENSLAPPPGGNLVERLPPGDRPLPADYLGPRAFKLRTASELAAALEKTEHALRCPSCQGAGAVRLAAFGDLLAGADGVRAADEAPMRRCDYCRGKAILNLTTAAYEQICELAEIVAFVRFHAEDPGPDRYREAAQTLLMAIGGQRDKCEIVGRLAGARLEDSQRQSNGIMLTGTVRQAQAEGELFAIQLMLLGGGKPVTVISSQPPDPPLAHRDRLILLGSIVDSPRDNLAGYAGALPQIVWGGLPLKLAASAR